MKRREALAKQRHHEEQAKSHWDISARIAKLYGYSDREVQRSDSEALHNENEASYYAYLASLNPKDRAEFIRKAAAQSLDA